LRRRLKPFFVDWSRADKVLAPAVCCGWVNRFVGVQRLCARTNSQPAPSQRSQVPARTNPVAEQAEHSFQSLFRIARPFVPAHRFPPTILPHSSLTSVASYDGALQCVHLATGVGLLVIRSCLSVRSPTLSGPVYDSLTKLSRSGLLSCKKEGNQ
jgi:hypothetical protein